MNDRKQAKNNQNTLSQLERFSLDFEYNKTLSQIRHEVKARTIS
ncbi:MAG: hypothetical protein WBI29_03160 [Candidatus Saccharimonadales bacterium]